MTEAVVVDDQTFFLLREADNRIHRAEMLIEQHRLHVLTVHPSRRHSDETHLKSLMSEYIRLLNYRHALTTEPSRDYMN